MPWTTEFRLAIPGHSVWSFHAVTGIGIVDTNMANYEETQASWHGQAVEVMKNIVILDLFPIYMISQKATRTIQWNVPVVERQVVYQALLQLFVVCLTGGWWAALPHCDAPGSACWALESQLAGEPWAERHIWTWQFWSHWSLCSVRKFFVAEAGAAGAGGE